MSKEFAFDAPQFIDFEAGETENTEHIESYFDFDHENVNIPSSNVDLENDPNSCSHSSDNCTENYNHENENEIDATGASEDLDTDFYSPEKTSMFPNENDKLPNGLRKSMSMSCLNKAPIKHTSSNISVNLGSKTKSVYSEITSSQTSLKSTDKYVSMAELINKFQSMTPDRFHSKPKNATFHAQKLYGPLSNTIPHSPALLTKNRHRPVTVVSSEERELLEYEEVKKNPFKAQPVNANLFRASSNPKISQPKTVTQIKPFHLTEPKKKVVPPSPKQVIEFQANPVPKSVYDYKKPIIKPPMTTQTMEPKFMKKYAEVQRKKWEKREEVAKPKAVVPRPARTKPIPFSFESRDLQTEVRKQKKIKQVLEEEAKAREFHANPMPKAVYRSSMRKNSSCDSIPSMRSDDGQPTTFKARPASVLYTEPFIPKKLARPLIEVTDFKLNTDERRQKRIEFEEKLKEKERQMAENQRAQEQERLKAEEEEIARIRKEAVHVARPIRRYKEVKASDVRPITQPVTPNFASKRIRSNKENYA